MSSRAGRPGLPSRNASELRGAGRLAIDGIVGVTDIVEAMHAAIGHGPALLGPSAPVLTSGVTGFVYGSVRGVARLVGAGVELSISALAPLLARSGLSPRREALVAAINGVCGDHLEASDNPLAIAMRFRVDGEALPLTRRGLGARLPGAGSKLLVLVHGLCMNDRQWNTAGHDHGEALARELGYTPVCLHYNSGRRMSGNGREFAGLLGRLVRAWPVPVEEIVLLCHSMGGLVARSALDVAFEEQRAWTKLPIRIVFLGTPHHGAPLERAGSWADMLIGMSPYSAPLAKLGGMRSAGIQDLRHGSVWPLPKGVRAYAIAGSKRSASVGRDAARMPGDGLVPVASAFGEHRDAAFDLGIPMEHRWLGRGIGHLELLGSEEVGRRVVEWLRS